MSASPSSDISAEAARWVARRRNGDISAADQQVFRNWLEADEVNKLAYDQAEKLWRELGGLRAVAVPQLREARAFLARRRRRVWSRNVLGFALVASAAGLVGWNAGWLSYPGDHSYRTAVGERKAVTLADGSRLELDTASEVTVHYSNSGRELRLLQGRAAFTVAHEKGRPFEVLAGTGRIRDIGTQFEVRERAGRVEVAVLEGEVEVAGGDGAAGRYLRQGQRTSYDAAGVMGAIEPVDLVAAAAWRSGRIVFNSQPLGEVLAELRRYHPDSVVVTTPALLKTTISGTVPVEDLAVALTTLSVILPAKLSRTGPQSWQIDG